MDAAAAARNKRGFSAAVERRWTLAVAAGASVVSVAASLPDARHFVFWDDEFASAKVLLEPTIFGALGRIARAESTPPAWYVLAWVIHYAGVTLYDLRVLSVIFAAALAGLSVLYARRFVSLFGAALVGILVALGGVFMRHSWELRAYSMFAVLCMVFALTLEWTVRSASKRRLAALAVVVALGSTTHYFFLFTLFAGLVWVWLTPSARSVRRRVTVAAALGLIPAVVWSPWFVKQTAAEHTKHFAGFSLPALGQAYGRNLTTGFPTHSGFIAIYVVTDILVVAGLIVLFRRGGLAVLCALLALSPLVFAGVFSLAGFHILDYRNLIGSAPFVAVAFVVALDAIPLRALSRVAIATAFVVAVYGFLYARQGPPRRRPLTPQESVEIRSAPSSNRRCPATLVGRTMGM
jgi:hypothetical protein